MSVTRRPSAEAAGSLSGKDPEDYRPHALHAVGRTYLETNCYTDVLIELLHACGYEPLAAFGHLVRMDFEGDQWTFFKPPPEDLESLFGIDIHEMQPYRPLPLQISEQLRAGRTIIVELDAWYLPDTASTSYRREHVKTSVAADAIDPVEHSFRYFHNTGLHELRDDDYRGALRLDPAGGLPPYAELVRFDAGPRLEGAELRRAAGELLLRHLGKRPARTRSSPSANGCPSSCPTCSAPTWTATTPTPSPRSGWPEPRSSSPPLMSSGCSERPPSRPARRWRRSSRAARCSRSAWPGGGRSRSRR